MAVFEEEERRAETEIYTGDASLGKRALQRVLMRKQLQQMEIELRELMVYQSPPELGALYTEVEEMMKEMGGQQKILLTKKMRNEERAALRRRQKMKMYMTELTYAGLTVVLALTMVLLMAYVSHDRKTRWPQLEPEAIAQRKHEKLEWYRQQDERHRLEEIEDHQ